METIIFIYVLGYLITSIAISSIIAEKDKTGNRFAFLMTIWVLGVFIWWIYLGLMLGFSQLPDKEEVVKQ